MLNAVFIRVLKEVGKDVVSSIKIYIFLVLKWLKCRKSVCEVSSSVPVNEEMEMEVEGQMQDESSEDKLLKVFNSYKEMTI